jgi:hypothetical protein
VVKKIKLTETGEFIKKENPGAMPGQKLLVLLFHVIKNSGNNPMRGKSIRCPYCLWRRQL